MRRLRTRSIRATIIGLLLCAFTIGLTGFPVYRTAGKDRSKPFPCMDKPCGCSDAATCWKQCCCHTNTEKVAWAKKHGVTPPSYVVEAARKEAPKVAACCQPKAVKSCCSAAKPACCSAAKPACCSAAKPACCQKPEPEPAAVEEEKDDWQVVALEDYRKCRGLSPLWLLLGQAVECRIEPIAVAAPVAGERIGILSERAECVHSPPDLPPPRKAHA